MKKNKQYLMLESSSSMKDNLENFWNLKVQHSNFQTLILFFIQTLDIYFSVSFLSFISTFLMKWKDCNSL